MRNSRARVALILIAVILLSLRFESLAWVLPLLALVLAAVAGYEILQMGVRKGIQTTLLVIVGAVAFAAAGVFQPGTFIWLLLPFLVILLIGSFLYHMWLNGVRDGYTTVAVNVFAPIYVGIPIALGLQVLRTDKLFLLVVLLATWALDTGAYFVGRKFGQTKMAPQLSPKKTWEGAAGGAFACILIILLFNVAVPAGGFEYGLAEMLLLGVLISVFGILGDLAESVLKRDVGVKESGVALTGHGGVLDRIDSLLFVLPIAYLFLMFTGRMPVFEAILATQR